MAGVVLFILGAVGLALVVRGFAGRRVGEEPHCQGCLYDLSGIEKKADSCPECGASLSATKAIVRGLRKRRLAAILVGVLMMAVTGGLVGVNVWAKANDFDFNTIKPTWLLLRSIENNKQWDDPLPINEFVGRLNAELLSDASINRFAAAILESRPLTNSPPTGSPQLREACFQGLLTHPNTPDAVRSQMVAASISDLQQQLNRTPSMRMQDSPILHFNELNHLMAAGLMTDAHVRLFLPLSFETKLSIGRVLGEGNKTVAAVLTPSWSPAANPRFFATYIAMPWNRASPWIAQSYATPAILIECKPIDDELDVAANDTQNWVVTPYGLEYFPFGPSQVTDPLNSATVFRGFTSASLSSQIVGHIRTPRQPGSYNATFEVRLTLLKSDASNLGKYLRPDATNVSVVQRIEARLVVEPNTDSITRSPSPIPIR